VLGRVSSAHFTVLRDLEIDSMLPLGLPDILADPAILDLHEGAGRRIAIESAKLGGRDLAVRALRAVLLDDVEQHEAARLRLLSLGHAVASSC
jgi:hypothetical protein